MHTEHHEQTFTKRRAGNVSRLQVMSPGGNVEVRLTPLQDGKELRAVLSVKQTTDLCAGLLNALHDCGVSIGDRNRICDTLKLHPTR